MMGQTECASSAVWAQKIETGFRISSCKIKRFHDETFKKNKVKNIVVFREWGGKSKIL